MAVPVAAMRSLSSEKALQIRRSRRSARGQATVEFAISSIVVMLMLAGLLDLSRVFYFQINLYGAAYEGVRHGVWFDTPNRRNPYLQDDRILAAVNSNLTGAGLPVAIPNQSPNLGSCPVGDDGNAYGNPPYEHYNNTFAGPDGLYTSSSLNQPIVFICYTPPKVPNAGCLIGTSPVTTITAAPADNCWRLGDLQVAVLMRYALVTPFLQGVLGNGLHTVSNAHMEIQGKP